MQIALVTLVVLKELQLKTIALPAGQFAIVARVVIAQGNWVVPGVNKKAIKFDSPK